VLGAANFSVGNGYFLRFPAPGWYTWRGSIVEGRGVKPDVDVPISTTELRKGIDKQFEAALAMNSEIPPVGDRQVGLGSGV
jgi:C-terminal processing protease CtpA/Prc